MTDEAARESAKLQDDLEVMQQELSRLQRFLEPLLSSRQEGELGTPQNGIDAITFVATDDPSQAFRLTYSATSGLQASKMSRAGKASLKSGNEISVQDYYLKTEFTNHSDGIVHAGKPILLSPAGLLHRTFFAPTTITGDRVYFAMAVQS